MNTIFDVAYLIPLFPLLGFLINGLGRKVNSKTVTAFVGSAVIFISFCLSLLVFSSATGAGFVPRNLQYFNFISIGKLSIPFEFQIDQLTSIFLLIITGVGFLIHVYSTSYMKEEDQQGYARYFAYLNLFVFSMLLLVMGGNYVIMFMGWEGVGLCSYLLIGFWFKNTAFNNAAKKAFIMNRIGDFGFILGIFWLINAFGTTSYSQLFGMHTAGTALAAKGDPGVLTAISLLLFVGATGKSAQIPLYTWLPDAMAGPTPVSALIHAATMVTAGIYMIARSNIIYALSPLTMTVVAIIGTATAIFAAVIALQQNDIKKVLAYSTVSQLGYMFLGLGVGAFSASVFHVMTHAFFKALLFLGAGSVIHAMGGEQDIMKMGGLGKKMKITYITFFIACLAIAGIPPFAGFFSKDQILSAAYASNPLYYYLGVAGALLTAFYMFRLMALTFAGKFRGTDQQWDHVHESPSAVTIPLIALGVLSALGGLVGIPEVLMNNGNKLNTFLSPVFADAQKILTTHQTTSPQTELVMMGVSSLLIIAVSIWAWNKFRKFDGTQQQASGLVKAIQHKFYVDEIYDFIIVKPLRAFSGFLGNVVEKSGIDALVNAVGRGVNYSSRQIRLLQSGLVGNYILLMVAGLILLLIIQFFTK
jgi:NADH-quinone oxidoreductase subunit L